MSVKPFLKFPRKKLPTSNYTPHATPTFFSFTKCFIVQEKNVKLTYAFGFLICEYSSLLDVAHRRQSFEPIFYLICILTLKYI